MGRKSFGHKVQRGEKTDFSYEERLQKENENLKKENKRLKKELSKAKGLIDRVGTPDKMAAIDDLLRRQRKQERAIRNKESQTSEDKWLCHDCGRGHLRIFIFNRQDGVFYYRTCDFCNKKTPMQRYNKETVENS